ncbi:hypothetical protein BDW59DRAFT_3493 [Aspergillus cavernicola]|uniref:Required for respiratory growth protein 8, mitochondrial n=1 Tax=Aspergillus cavernicola TaxID=176166 RepID=A0ABR4J4X8_9EURO
MEHLHSRIPYAQWRLGVFRRLFIPSVSSDPAFLSRRVHSHGPDDVHENSNTAATSNDKHQPNSSGNETSESTSTITPSSLLPQSPLLTNPKPGVALRHRKKRSPTTDDLSDLRKNPWAMALASPVRQCGVSGTRMPKALLTDWGMVEGPASPVISSQRDNSPNATDKAKGTKLWLLPVSLIKGNLKNPTQGQSDATRPHLQIRIIDRMPVLETLTKWINNSRKSKYTPLSRLIPFRWKPPFGPMTAVEESRLVWRRDMPEYVLRMMRLDVLKQLKSVSDTFKRQDVPNGVWRSIDVQGPPYAEKALIEGLGRMETFDRMECGVVLVLGEGTLDAGAASNIPKLIMLPTLGSKVPAFNLTRLFSQAELEEIRAHDPRFQKFAVFLRPSSQLAIDAVLALWKLQGYIRDGRT